MIAAIVDSIKSTNDSDTSRIEAVVEKFVSTIDQQHLAWFIDKGDIPTFHLKTAAESLGLEQALSLYSDPKNANKIAHRINDLNEMFQWIQSASGNLDLKIGLIQAHKHLIDNETRSRQNASYESSYRHWFPSLEKLVNTEIKTHYLARSKDDYPHNRLQNIKRKLYKFKIKIVSSIRSLSKLGSMPTVIMNALHFSNIEPHDLLVCRRIFFAQNSGDYVGLLEPDLLFVTEGDLEELIGYAVDVSAFYLNDIRSKLDKDLQNFFKRKMSSLNSNKKAEQVYFEAIKDGLDEKLSECLNYFYETKIAILETRTEIYKELKHLIRKDYFIPEHYKRTELITQAEWATLDSVTRQKYLDRSSAIDQAGVDYSLDFSEFTINGSDFFLNDKQSRVVQALLKNYLLSGSGLGMKDLSKELNLRLIKSKNSEGLSDIFKKFGNKNKGRKYTDLIQSNNGKPPVFSLKISK